MRGAARLLPAVCALLLSACATLSPRHADEAAGIAEAARSRQVDCAREDACALPSPVMAMAAEAGHRALILDDAPDSLLLRVHLIRSAHKRGVTLILCGITEQPLDMVRRMRLLHQPGVLHEPDLASALARAQTLLPLFPAGAPPAA